MCVRALLYAFGVEINAPCNVAHYSQLYNFESMSRVFCLILAKQHFPAALVVTQPRGQAISMKESQLIGNVTMNIEDTTEGVSGPVRIIAPKEEVLKDFTNNESDPNVVKFNNIQGDLLDDKETENLQGSLSISSWNENNIPSSLSEISSYEDFMEHIDQKLHDIEAELVTVLNASTLVLDSEERPKNSRLQQMMELLESIHGIRRRLAESKAPRKQK